MNFKLSPMAILTLALLAGCASEPERPAMTGAHEPAGASSGPGEAARLLASLSDADQAYMTQRINRALNTAVANQPVTWQNPDGEAQATLTATRLYQRADNVYCREFVESLIKGSHTQTARGTACQNADGTWQLAG